MRSKRLLFALYLLSAFNASAVYLDKRTITIDHTKVGTINNTDQTNFTVLFCANSVGNCSATISDFKTAANGGLIQHTTTCCATGLTVPADLIFTSDALCTTQVAGWDIESYSATTGAIVVWVLIGTVSHTSDTVFYACYNNALVTTYQATYTAAYDSNTKAVYHMNEPSGAGSINDSSGNGNNTPNNAGGKSGAVTTTGTIGLALDWASNAGTAISPTNNLPLTSAVRTTESWFNLNGHVVSQAWLSYGNTPSVNRWGFVFNASNFFVVELAGQETDGPTVTPDSNWHQLVGVLPTAGGNAGTILIYFDGVAVATTHSGSSTLNTSNAQLVLSSLAETAGFSFLGKIDESKIIAAVRTADWINTEYKNQSNPGTFLSISGLISGSIHHRSTLQ